MKLNYENTLKIKSYVERNNLELETSTSFAFGIYKNLQYPRSNLKKSLSVSDRIAIAKKQIDFIQKSVVNLKYEENGSKAKNLKCRYVYAIKNESWPEFIKIGSTVDVFDRLNSYQTYSPMRNFELIDYAFCEDRLLKEKEFLSSFERNGEWIKAEEKTVLSYIDNKIRVYPVEEILEFCLKECFKAYFISFKERKNNKEIIKIFCKSQSKIFSNLFGLEDKDVHENLNSRFGVVHKGYEHYIVPILGLNFKRNGENLEII